ncbi:hypothetical protein L1887_13386 [Cichorium endivia]|nr:hypothetical protein L1887_13386 [Cichorium endivia]
MHRSFRNSKPISPFSLVYSILLFSDQNPAVNEFSKTSEKFPQLEVKNFASSNWKSGNLGKVFADFVSIYGVCEL